MGFDRGRKGDRGGRGRDKRDGFGVAKSCRRSTAVSPTAAALAVLAAAVASATAAAAVAVAIAAVVAVAATAAAAAAAASAAAAAGGGGGGFRGGGGGGGGMPPQVVGEGKGVVKFFNPQKGFGFIVRDDGGEDVFVHISAVEQAGLTDLADGQPLEFTLVDRGGRVSATDLKIDGEPMEVDRGAGAARGGPRGRRLRRRRRAAASADRRKGSGHGQVLQRDEGLRLHQRDDGQPDAFVHISAVERAGLPTLNEGDRFEFEIEVDRRGKYAAVNLQPLQG